MFITFEGIEGCGKTTQSKLLADYLESIAYEVLLTREPGGPQISEKIRDILLDEENGSMKSETELLLYLACRAQHTSEWLIPALKRRCIVVCDRYTDSTLAYQGGGRSLDDETLFELTKFASQGLTPDVTILIDIPVELAMHRISLKRADRLEKESEDFYKRVRSKFLDVAKKDSQRCIVLDGTKSINEIHIEIREIIVEKIKDGLK